MTTCTKTPLEARREELDRARREILQRLREGSGPRHRDSLRLPTEEELGDPFLNLEGPIASGVSSILRIVCVHADAFGSIAEVVAWFERHEPSFAAISVVLPQYCVVGTAELGWRDVAALSRIGASYEQLPPELEDLHAWLCERYPGAARDYTPPKSRSPISAVASPRRSSSSLDSWDRDREDVARAHVRGLRMKDELLSRDDDPK